MVKRRSSAVNADGPIRPCCCTVCIGQIQPNAAAAKLLGSAGAVTSRHCSMANNKDQGSVSRSCKMLRMRSYRVYAFFHSCCCCLRFHLRFHQAKGAQLLAQVAVLRFCNHRLGYDLRARFCVATLLAASHVGCTTTRCKPLRCRRRLPLASACRWRRPPNTTAFLQFGMRISSGAVSSVVRRVWRRRQAAAAAGLLRELSETKTSYVH
jgi:hypothetical protein